MMIPSLRIPSLSEMSDDERRGPAPTTEGLFPWLLRPPETFALLVLWNPSLVEALRRDTEL